MRPGSNTTNLKKDLAMAFITAMVFFLALVMFFEAISLDPNELNEMVLPPEFQFAMNIATVVLVVLVVYLALVVMPRYMRGAS